MPLKTDPKYGYFPWWPEDGDGWLHPDDVATARRMIPSERVFRRDGGEGDYLALFYGNVRLRIRPVLWQEVRGEGYEIGDWVEVLSRGQLNTPRAAVIAEIHYDVATRALRYQVRDGEQMIPNWYVAADLRPVELTAPREQLVLEPPANEGELGLGPSV